jgi:hypothetical protein
VLSGGPDSGSIDNAVSKCRDAQPQRFRAEHPTF